MLIVVLIVVPIVVLIVGLLGGVLFGLLGGLLFGLLFGLLGGLRASIQVRNTIVPLQPNQGIRNSRRSGLRVALIYVLIVGLSFGPLVGLLIGLLGMEGMLLFGQFGGLLFGLLFGLGEHGWDTVMRHYVLRWLLARQGILPFPFKDQSLIAYLDAMADRILLRRVGGGWVFIHRTLLDYFASLHPDAAPELAGANHPDASESG